MLFGDDVWGVIGLYAAYAPLRRVCRRLCALLRDQHLKVQVSPSNVLDVVAHLGEVVDMVRSLVLTAPRCAQLSIREAHSALFAQLLLCKNLQALSLALRLQAADASWAKSFATLQNLSSLEFIELHWSDNNVGPMGVGYLARLLQGHFIKGLYLDIARNAITTSGVEQWVSVIPSCSLSSLCLTLSENRLGDCGAQLLRACLNCHSLRILKLSLDDCSIPTLFPATQGQRLQSQLTTLSVDLARNPLTDVDILAQHLSSQTPALRNLPLALCGTQLSTPAAQTLLAHIDDLLHLECRAQRPPTSFAGWIADGPLQAEVNLDTRFWHPSHWRCQRVAIGSVSGFSASEAFGNSAHAVQHWRPWCDSPCIARAKSVPKSAPYQAFCKYGPDRGR